MISNAVEQAEVMFGAGRFQQGINALGDAARNGDPAALEYLGRLCLEGAITKRDLPLSRDLFRRAAQSGSASSAAIYRAFVANGTGGAADWPLALNLLQQAARTDADADRELKLIEAMALDEEGNPIEEIPPRPLSDSPKASEFPAIFTTAECEWLTDISTPGLSPSVVVDPQTKAQVPNPVRTSDAMGFPWVAEGPAIHALCRRLALASGTEVKQGEPLQVLRYRPGQQYKPHFDAIGNADNQRTLTFLVYLNDDYEGGETEFLHTGLKIKGRKGNGLLFRNVDQNGRPDASSQHAGLPVTFGEKFLASRWIRARPFGTI